MILSSAAQHLVAVLALEPIDLNLFSGQHEHFVAGRLFGGQILAQALAAANNTVEPKRTCHSLHAYFLRPGRPDIPVIYQVERIRDDRSFTTRRIVAIQNGEAIFNMGLPYQLNEIGLEYKLEMTTFPNPEELEDDVVIAKATGETDPWRIRKLPFEMRSCQQKTQCQTHTINPV